MAGGEHPVTVPNPSPIKRRKSEEVGSVDHDGTFGSNGCGAAVAIAIEAVSTSSYHDLKPLLIIYRRLCESGRATAESREVRSP